MAKTFPMRITNCHQCGHESHGYYRTETPPRVFFCRHPAAVPDFGFGSFVTRFYGAMNQVQFYPKIRENHTKTIGNIKIPDLCPLEDAE